MAIKNSWTMYLHGHYSNVFKQSSEYQSGIFHFQCVCLFCQSNLSEPILQKHNMKTKNILEFSNLPGQWNAYRTFSSLDNLANYCRRYANHALLKCWIMIHVIMHLLSYIIYLPYFQAPKSENMDLEYRNIVHKNPLI